MPVRTATARWEGPLQGGKGAMRLGTGAFDGAYSFGTRFEEEPGTNPEELIAAAHSGCFSMAFAGALGRAGHDPISVATVASVTMERQEAGFRIVGIHLETEAEVPGIEDAAFQEIAEGAKKNCPVSVALSAVPITVTATLK